jgi:hypothetical protein
MTALPDACFSLQLQQQQTRLMKINHDLRHRVTVVEAQGKALIEQKVELEADLQTKEQEMGSLRAELGKLRERLQGEHSQNGEEEEAEVSRKWVLPWCGDPCCGPAPGYSVVSLKNTEISYECVFVLIQCVEVWGCFGLLAAADCDLSHALARAWFCQQQLCNIGILGNFQSMYKC